MTCRLKTFFFFKYMNRQIQHLGRSVAAGWSLDPNQLGKIHPCCALALLLLNITTGSTFVFVYFHFQGKSFKDTGEATNHSTIFHKLEKRPDQLAFWKRDDFLCFSLFFRLSLRFRTVISSYVFLFLKHISSYVSSWKHYDPASVFGVVISLPAFSTEILSSVSSSFLYGIF